MWMWSYTSVKMSKVNGNLFILHLLKHTDIPSSNTHTSLWGFSPWLATVLMWQAFPYQTTCTMKSLKRLSQNPGLLSACHAVFMHWHVEWETSFRTTIHSSSKYTLLANIKAAIFRHALWRRPVVYRVFCLQRSQKETEMAGGGRMKRDVMRIERTAQKTRTMQKQRNNEKEE